LTVGGTGIVEDEQGIVGVAGINAHDLYGVVGILPRHSDKVGDRIIFIDSARIPDFVSIQSDYHLIALGQLVADVF
jgi:hypothetical protein